MTQPVPVGGGYFEVDISRAPDAIRELEQALAELRDIKAEARSLAQATPPTSDLVTLDAVAVLGRKATDGPGSLMNALDEGIAEVSRLIEQLRFGFDAYSRSDADVVARYRPRS
ncbi:hypothetical protein [Actinomycetospora flava]|uniref:PE family protein n=1 Tax=Actinomycetospora flava TaxID=3129232 RepID=A0ABU8M623_9PSEU